MHGHLFACSCLVLVLHYPHSFVALAFIQGYDSRCVEDEKEFEKYTYTELALGGQFSLIVEVRWALARERRGVCICTTAHVCAQSRGA